MTKTADDTLKLLRAPFPDNQISKKPKETKQQKEERERNRNIGIRCQLCGQWHHKDAIHLDYVGHAALTDRLLDVDPTWNWEPVSFAPDGQPAFDRMGGMWIKLTVCGCTRLGYGHADGKQGGDAVKEVIGDALRNAAMRFGAALDLWHKGDLHLPEGSDDAESTTNELAPRQVPMPNAAPKSDDAQKLYSSLEADMRLCRSADDLARWWKDAECVELRKRLPDDWQETLYDAFAALGKELRGKEDGSFPGSTGTGVYNGAGRELHAHEAG